MGWEASKVPTARNFINFIAMDRILVAGREGMPHARRFVTRFKINSLRCFAGLLLSPSFPPTPKNRRRLSGENWRGVFTFGCEIAEMHFGGIGIFHRAKTLRDLGVSASLRF